MAKKRKLEGTQSVIVTILCVGISIMVFFTAFKGSFPAMIQRAGYLMFLIPIIFLLVPANNKHKIENRIPFMDIIFAILAAISFGWILINYERVVYRLRYVSEVTNLDLIFGIIAILLILEVTRRTLGWILVILTSIFISYVFVGPFLPGVFSFNQIPYDLFIEHIYLVPEGIFNVMTGLTSTYLFTFIAFGCFLQVLGADKYYMDICLALAGKSRGGPAKVAVISSALVGTISGSSIANVTITGSLTIPMMKDTGFLPKDAAAIETAASTGGGLMPPVMGAGVFVMAAMTGIPLITIITVSFIPAILYFFSIYVFVEIKSAQYNLKGLSKDKIPSLWNSIKKSYLLFIPLIVLVVLMVAGYTPFIVSAYCTVLIVIFSYLNKELRINFKKFIQALRFSCESMMTITAVSACAAIIMGALTLTGLVLKITSILIAASNGILPILLFLLAFVSYILGMGLPVTLSYILVAMLGAPALTQFGVPLLAAHLFIFWISQVATISPPVCMTAFVAAEIAQEKDYMKVGFTSLNVAKAIYLIPLFFIYTSILEGSIFVQLRIFLQAILLIIIINIFSEGYFMGFLKNWERALLGLLAILQCYSIFSHNIFNQIIFTILGLLALIWIAYNHYKIKFKEK